MVIRSSTAVEETEHNQACRDGVANDFVHVCDKPRSQHQQNVEMNPVVDPTPRSVTPRGPDEHRGEQNSDEEERIGLLHPFCAADAVNDSDNDGST